LSVHCTATKRTSRYSLLARGVCQCPQASGNEK